MLTTGLELDEVLFFVEFIKKKSKKVVLKTIQNWKIYLQLNKAESHCENDSELTKGLDLDEDLFAVEQMSLFIKKKSRKVVVRTIQK